LRWRSSALDRLAREPKISTCSIWSVCACAVVSAVSATQRASGLRQCLPKAGYMSFSWLATRDQAPGGAFDRVRSIGGSGKDCIQALLKIALRGVLMRQGIEPAGLQAGLESLRQKLRE